MTKDGRIITVSLVVSPIIDYHGAHHWRFLIAHDITERKRLQDRILRAKNEWELTFDAVPDMIAFIDRNYNILRINRAMAERFGVGPEDIWGQPCFTLVHGRDRPIATCPQSLLLGDGKIHTVEIRDDRLGCRLP